MTVFASIVPALLIRRTQGGSWVLADILSKVVVNADEMSLPGGLPVYLRFTVYGSGRIEGTLVMRTFDEPVEVLITQGYGFDVPASPQSGERQVTIFETSVVLPINRLFPRVAASSVGSPVQSTFILDLTVQDGEALRVIASAPIILQCNPALKENHAELR